jgi:hypothetical protein
MASRNLTAREGFSNNTVVIRGSAMNIKTQALALAIAAGLSTAAFAQVDEAAPPPPVAAESEATGERSQPLQRNSPADAAVEPESSASSVPSTGAIEDKKIEQFADAYLAVESIQRSASAELQANANDPAKVAEVKTKAETAMIAAVEQNGLDVNEFNQIIQTMSADANVRSRVAAKLEERSSGPTP